MIRLSASECAGKICRRVPNAVLRGVWREVEHGGDLRKSKENAVHNGADAHIVGKHVVDAKHRAPSDLSGEVLPDQSEEHRHNVQHNCLYSQ